MTIVQVTTDNREPFREYDKPVPWFGTAPEALLQGFAQFPEAKIHVIGCTQKPMVASPDKLADNIWFHSLLVPKLGWLRTGYQGCIRAVRQKVKQLKPDIVHGQGTERECSLSAIFSGFPNVLTIHGNMREIERINRPPPFSYGWLAARLEAFTVPRSNGVVCITDYTKRALAGLARRAWVIPNAVDSSFFELERAPESKPVVLCVGNISVRKNQIAFMRALDPLSRSDVFSVIFLGGLGKDDPYAAEFLREAKLRPWCSYEGFADRSTLKKYFRRAAMLALPSLEDNCPMVVLEAMAAGVPVVAANVGGVPDLISSQSTGLLFDPQDAHSMCDSVRTMLREKALAERLAQQAKSEAFQRFRPVVIARRHLDVYRELLSTSA